MNRSVRFIALALLALALWPELMRYRAEWQLAQANGRLSRVLLGKEQGDTARASAQAAGELAERAAAALPDDTRVALLRGVALILSGRSGEAKAIFDAAIAHGERPELTLNLGRVRASLGDEAGADAAFLRTAWASANAIVTLPKATRDPLIAKVRSLEQDLRAGTMREPPPL